MHTQKMEAIGTLAGGIAHDFNNILSAVIGYGELAVLDVPPDNPSYRGIQEIVKAGYRAKEVIQQILTFSRRSDSERKPVQMKSIVEEIHNMLKTTLPANIEMKIDIQTDGLIHGDPSRLHQILMNLCTNSLPGDETRRRNPDHTAYRNGQREDTVPVRAQPEVGRLYQAQCHRHRMRYCRRT